ncbi:Murein DD-endopeptidase MepM and murein hydrolase activator NlpD, contain LysM domain [Nocardioides sp. YR527]|uniref:M23 family metallopeptidase n=1 Tax=Nocardioides sp. YR527 TaxID=1881028 RepID=UPI00088F1647|nr:M23 family metallopeptidase [Nocardioides sp. YR527]SDK79883.1 Murein DD-endopeptidase MepM and murein hydrolase activator NlpD, contain LysM domain [Nocardioides sp. YR527]
MHPARLGATRLSRPFLALLIGCVLAGTLITPLARADDSLEDQQEQIEKEKEAAENAVEHSSDALQRATATLATAQKKLAGARNRLEKTDVRLRAAARAHRRAEASLERQRAVLEAARTDLRTARKRATESREDLRDTILEEFTAVGDPRLEEFSALLEGATLEELMRRRNYTDAVTSSKASTLERLEAGERLVARRERGQRRATAAVAATERTAAQKVAEVKRLRARATEARDEIAALVTRTAAAKKKAAALAEEDRKVLAELEKQDAAIEEKIAALAEGAQNRTVDTLVGMLEMPVADSYVTSPYGMRTHPTTGEYKLHDGVDLHAPCGTPLLAAESGTVIAQEWNDAYGNRLHLFLGKINGHSYTAIYNHLSAYRSEVDDTVARGDVIGLAGTTGWSTGCHLHFMILKDGEIIDPMPLLGL